MHSNKTFVKEIIKEGVAIFFRFSGIPFFIKHTICRRRATVVIYHKPDAKVFANHIDYYKKHFNIICLNDLVDAICQKRWSGIPKRSLVITIDDGFKENFHLLNIIKEKKVNITLYVCSHIVNSNRKFWFESGIKDPLRMMAYSINKRLELLEKEVHFKPEREYSDRQALSLDELKEMGCLMNIQSHSKLHPVLPTCSDAECREEIADSKKCLEQMLQKPIRHFSYPNGDYTQREIAILIENGYRSARTVDLGWNGPDTDPFKLKGMGIQDNASINVLSAQLFGFFGWIRFMRHGSYNGMHPLYT